MIKFMMKIKISPKNNKNLKKLIILNINVNMLTNLIKVIK